MKEISACSICNEQNDLVFCLDCDNNFCNSSYNSEGLNHITIHLAKFGHKQIGFKKIVHCFDCEDNIFSLLEILDDKSQYCNDCSPENLPYEIEEARKKTFLNPDKSFKKPPRIKDDYTDVIRVPLKFINRREYLDTFMKLLKEEDMEIKLNKNSGSNSLLKADFADFEAPNEKMNKLQNDGEVNSDVTASEIENNCLISAKQIRREKITQELEPVFEIIWDKMDHITEISLFLDGPYIPYKSAKYALVHLNRCCDESLYRSILKGTKETPAPVEVNYDLNMSQKSAVQSALSQRITLIQGPPGTGKTKTSAYVVKSLVEKGYKVMVVAPTNTAVDNLAQEMLRLKLKTVRVSTKSHRAVDPCVQESFLDYKIKKKIQTELDEYRKLYPWKKIDVENFNNNDIDPRYIKTIGREIIYNAEVIACTCAKAGDPIFEEMSFTAVLVDEAAQATEPLTLIPLLYNCQKLILVGDQKQLDPFVVSEKAKYGRLDQSMFLRLIKAGIKPVFLDTQYRMHPEILEFPNKEFYEGKIQSENKTSSEKNFMHPTFFYCSFRREEVSNTSSSFYNWGEVLAVQEIVNFLDKNGVENHQIGIITFYEAQKCLLKEFIKEIEIENVDAFQGREKDYIVLSLVRSNDLKDIGFVRNEKRMNVALTRAKQGLIIVGNPLTIKCNPNWNKLLKMYDRRNLLMGGKINDLKNFMFTKGAFDFEALYEEIIDFA